MTDPTPNDGEKAPGTSGVLLQAKGLTIRTRAGENLLSDISFHVEPGELVALAGLSRSGKSTLLQSLAGLMEPTSGEILIDGINLYTHRKAFRPIIGFVPADFALHQHLTVAEILQDEAALRLPRSTFAQDRKQRILTILETVGLSQVTNRQVRLLSEVEKRKLSIAVELIGYPKLLLVDQPVGLLAPFDEVQITILMRELSRQGLTIVYVNPRARSVGLSDNIIYLAPGGVLVWFGPSEEAFTYLRSLLPRGVVKDLFGLQEALEILVNPQVRDGIEWAKRFKEHESYSKYVDDPLNNRYPDLQLQTRPLLRIRLRSSASEKLPPPIIPRANAVQKFFLLIRRSFRLLWRDKTGLLALAIPPLVALIHFFFSYATQLDPGPPALGLDLRFFLIILTAGFLVQHEIFRERAIFQREHRANPLLFPYILSKLWLVGIFALYQGLVWTLIHSFEEIQAGLAGRLQDLLPSGVMLFLLAFVGGLLGLLASALSRTAMTSTGWVLLLTIPQILFIFNTLSHWSKLGIISLFLIALLVLIQQGTASVRTS